MIQILLATFNGEKYIRTQLDSILNQTYVDWQVVIHDDGSTDNTCNLIQAYCQLHPQKFVFLEDGLRFGNARDNFAHLLKYSSADYVMFCDQDDVWLPTKIEKTYQKLLALEELHGKEAPIVVHTDLEVVDQDLNLIAPSMFEYQGLYTVCSSLTACLAKNSVTGCTMMLNSSTRRVSMPISSNAMMHDWWIVAKVIQAGGFVEWLDESLIQYRQHGGNAVGAKRNGVKQLLNRVLNYAWNGNVRSKIWQQAKEIDPSLSYARFFAVKLALSIRSLF